MYIITIKNNTTTKTRKEVKTMKTHTTIKSIRNNWDKKFQAFYCDLQFIYRGVEPNYYNAGIYGWNCDIYCDFKRDIAISTGYRNMTGRIIPDEIIEKYSNIAKEIAKNTWSKPYEETRKALDENIENFLNELDNM